jgi:two-component system response regulator YesN
MVGSEEENDDDISFKLIDQQKLLISYLGEGDIDIVYNLFDTLLEEVRAGGVEFYKSVIVNLFKLCELKIKNFEVAKLERENIRSDVSKLSELDNIDEVYIKAKQILGNIIDSFSKNKNSMSLMISRAKSYIEEHYNSELLLEDVASYIYISPSYFGRVFKEKVGQRFTDYIIQIRMEKAKKFLINQNYKVYEICHLVGYNTPKHFYKLFKEYVGLTPTEYRIKILNRE